MKKMLLLVPIILMANKEPIKYIAPTFVDGNYRCDREQFNKAREEFIKCSDNPIFRECYARYIMKYCDLKPIYERILDE